MSRPDQCLTSYDPTQIPNLAALARAYTNSDRTFQIGQVLSFGAHIELVSTTESSPMPLPGAAGLLRPAGRARDRSTSQHNGTSMRQGARRRALVERDTLGRPQSVDIAGLLRNWAAEYDVFTSNRAASYVAPAGAAATLSRLAKLDERVVVTGSFAAVRPAPVAGPALLAAYCDDPAVTADTLDLLPTDREPTLFF